MMQELEALKVVDWRFSQVWNNSLITYGEKPFVPRDYIYASELGGSMIDRYLKMLGTKPTNPPNNRSLRKFQSGNIWEAIIGYVLLRAGILKKKQIRAEHTLPGCLRVSGRVDFIAGGEVDYEKALREVDELSMLLDLMPPFVQYATKQIIENFRAEYEGCELLTKIAEVKSVSSFVFERAMRTKMANPNHVLQNYHYIISPPQDDSPQIDFGQIIYVCRDDCRLIEFPIYSTSADTHQKYEADIKQMTAYYNNKAIPPKEKELIFDDGSCRFNKNFKVEYSPYLNLLYKYKTPKEYADKYKSITAGFNSTFKRCVDGKNLTELNKKRIKEAVKAFPLWDSYVLAARETGVLETVEEED